MSRTTMTSIVRPGIDRDWLFEQYRRDPVAHAFPRFDFEFAATQCRFTTLLRDGRPTSYLLLWYGNPELPIVHWCGDPTPDPELVDALPPRPFLGVLPEPVVDSVARARGPGVAQPLLVLVRDRDAAVGRARRDHTVRPLARHDIPELERMGEGQDDPIVRSYRMADPQQTPTWGAFLEGRLAGVARAQVRLPEVWIVTGVYTAPGARNRGIGGDVTAAVSRAAEESGAMAALVVREDNAPARRAYERVGFRPRGRRVHFHATDAPVH